MKLQKYLHYLFLKETFPGHIFLKQRSYFEGQKGFYGFDLSVAGKTFCLKAMFLAVGCGQSAQKYRYDL